QLATPGWPSRGQPLVAPPTEQQGLGAERLVEGDLGHLLAGRDQTDPASAAEALVTGRVLDDSVERDVLADHDLSHFRFSFRFVLAATSRARRWACRAAVGAVQRRRAPVARQRQGARLLAPSSPGP